MTDNTKMEINYFNTYIWDQLSIIMQNMNCSKESVLIYDGPNSKSKLLGELKQPHAEIYTFISSLSIISIYLLDSPLSKCFNISVFTIKQQPTGQLLKVPAAEEKSVKKHYEREPESIINQFQIQVPLGEFINVKMRQFVYTGNSEVGCYLGGIVILPTNKPPIGPLCGEVGRLIFEDSRLDGLTLGSHNADIIIFLYSGQIGKLLIDIIFSSDKCEGIPNLRDYNLGPLTGKYIDTHIQHKEMSYLQRIPVSLVALSFHQNPEACIKMQDFIDSVLRNTQGIEIGFYRPIDHFNINIRMVSYKGACMRNINNEPNNRFSNKYSPHTLHYLNKRKMLILSPPNVTSYTHLYAISCYYCSIFTTPKTACAPMYDGVSEIAFQQVIGETCSNEAMIRLSDLLLRPLAGNLVFKMLSTYAKCSSSVMEIADGLYGKSFQWRVGHQMTIQVSKSQVQHCTTQDIYVVINVVYNREGTHAYDLMYIIYGKWNKTSLTGPYGTLLVICQLIMLRISMIKYGTLLVIHQINMPCLIHMLCCIFM